MKGIISQDVPPRAFLLTLLPGGAGILNTMPPTLNLNLQLKHLIQRIPNDLTERTLKFSDITT